MKVHCSLKKNLYKIRNWISKSDWALTCKMFHIHFFLSTYLTYMERCHLTLSIWFIILSVKLLKNVFRAIIFTLFCMVTKKILHQRKAKKWWFLKSMKILKGMREEYKEYKMWDDDLLKNNFNTSFMCLEVWIWKRKREVARAATIISKHLAALWWNYAREIVQSKNSHC